MTSLLYLFFAMFLSLQAANPSARPLFHDGYKDKNTQLPQSYSTGKLSNPFNSTKIWSLIKTAVGRGVKDKVREPPQASTSPGLHKYKQSNLFQERAMSSPLSLAQTEQKESQQTLPSEAKNTAFNSYSSFSPLLLDLKPTMNSPGTTSKETFSSFYSGPVPSNVFPRPTFFASSVSSSLHFITASSIQSKETEKKQYPGQNPAKKRQIINGNHFLKASHEKYKARNSKKKDEHSTADSSPSRVYPKAEEFTLGRQPSPDSGPNENILGPSSVSGSQLNDYDRIITGRKQPPTSYHTLPMGGSGSYAFDSHPVRHTRFCLYSDCSNQRHIIMSFSKLNPKFRANRRIHQLERTEQNITGGELQILIISSCIWSHQRNMGFNETGRRAMYAFARDPQTSNPGLIVATPADPKIAGGRGCAETLRLEIPISAGPRIFVLLSQPNSQHSTFANVTSSVTSRAKLKPLDVPWNVAVLSGAKKLLKDDLNEDAQHRIYILSSAPYMQHFELTGAFFDTSGMDEARSISPKNNLHEPFCDTKGTEIAAAITGSTLGVITKMNATIVPVPISSCGQPATEKSVLRALLWVFSHMSERSDGITVIVSEELPYIQNPSKPMFKVLKELKKGGSFIFAPGIPCSKPEHAYVAVGPYGLRRNMIPKLGEMNGTCAKGFDIFVPGLEVLGASTIGPYSYRNVSMAPHIAAAGAASVLMGVLPQLSHEFDIDDLKNAFEKDLSSSKAYFGEAAADTVQLPVLGPRTLTELLNALILTHGIYKNTQENKAAPSIIPNLSNGALIGICAVAGALIVSMIAGVALISRRNADERSDFSYIVEDFANQNTDNVSLQDELSEKKKSIDSVIPVGGRALHAGEKAIASQQLQGPSLRPPIHETRSFHNRLADIGRLLSMSKDKDSPATPNAKASWFATPKGSNEQSRDVFKQDFGEGSIEAAKVLEDCSRDYVSTESTEVSPPVERDTSREPSPSDKS